MRRQVRLKIFKKKTFRGKLLWGMPKLRSKGLERVPDAQVGSACFASIDNVFVCFKFLLHLSGDSGQQTCVRMRVQMRLGCIY
jgi:hypothetical protein